MTSKNTVLLFNLHFTVWQFVRVMVHLEALLKQKPSKQHKEMQDLFESWEDSWVDLDAKLLDLGRNDPDAFASLMMDQEVVMEECTPKTRDIVCTLIDGVIDDLNLALSKTDDVGETEDLSFERDEMVSLARDFRALR